MIGLNPMRAISSIFSAAIRPNEKMGTEVPYLLAAGDIRSGSPRQIVTAVGDGATAAVTAQRILQEM